MAQPLTDRVAITAYNSVIQKRQELMIWLGSEDAAIPMAKRRAVEFEMDQHLSDYRTEPVYAQ